MSERLEELKQEADELGIEYNDRIGATKLQTRIDEFKETEATKAILDDETPDVEVVPVPEPESEEVVEPKPAKKVDPKVAAVMKIKARERELRKPKVVKMTMVDKREISTATSAYFSNGSQQMRIPLDVFVEVPLALILLAEEKTYPVNKRVGDSTVTTMEKKYIIEYKQK